MRKSLGFGGAALLISKLTAAQPAATAEAASEQRFSVALETDERAASCPDQAWFEGRIASYSGQAGHAGRYRIVLSRRGEAWHARIQRLEGDRETPASERVLQDRSTACEPLAEAAALTVALLAEDFAQKEEEVAAPEPAAPPSTRAPDPVEVPADPNERSSYSVWVGAGGGAALSWISPAAPVLGFGLALDSLHLRQGVRLMLTTEQQFELAPGRVFVQAWLASAFSCLQVEPGRFGAALCATLDGSMLRASAEGFDEGRPSTRFYGGAGIEVQPSWFISDSYRLSAAFSALLPFKRESFSVSGRGVAYVPPSVNWRVLLISELGAF
ncbi:MAG TPA: hypothetical protein VJN18_30390 [Polyangiaceae bacterium]|nr:hypothetical protein [Polyangiaceae bacterium]